MGLMDVRWELMLWHHLQICTSLHCIYPLVFRRFGFECRGKRCAAEGPGVGRYRKILAVLKHIENDACRGSVVSFLTSAERFAMHSEGAWLKVAGGQKAEVLEHYLSRGPCLKIAPSHADVTDQSDSCVQLGGRVVVECGSFIGYTASRLAAQLWAEPGDFGHFTPLLSIEADPIHVVIARHFVDLVKLATVAELRPGMVRDVFPSLVELFGGSTLAFVFMDQKGTTFHIDLSVLDKLDCWAPAATVVADNVLRPGAPEYVWMLASADHGIEPGFLSLPEFLEEAMGVEDWMAVANVL